jgi:hypothetical protein
MYYRFAVSKGFRHLCHGSNVFLFVFFIICIGGTLGQCTPLEKAWDISRTLPGRCLNTTAFFYFTSSINIITDVWVFLLPVKTLRKLQVSPVQKYALYAIFSAGALATVMSCVRLYSIHIYTNAEDPFRDGALVNLWSMIEINVAIICTSVPALKPLFNPRRMLESRRRSESQYHHRKHSERHRSSQKSALSHAKSGTAHSLRNTSSVESTTPFGFELRPPARSYV